MLTESRRRTCKSSEALKDLAPERSRTEVTRVELRGTRMEYATRGRFDGLGLKTIGGRFTGLDHKTRTEVPRRNGTARGGITEVALRQSKSVQKAWPSDQQKLGWIIIHSG